MKHHSSHYIERTLFSAFIALFIFSILFLVMDMESFTAFASFHTIQIAASCDKTNPPSLPCSESSYGTCSNTYSKETVLTSTGNFLCCCRPPPDIKITIPATT